eukprot:TRINITY_DN3543_c0_g1_i1.p1 TRINITY_DN3543_c0_g1~~TRINITY_DN3543_c0_g1_i1.p1  ORF type:complete len:306 (+),score=45.76 TRINITY_DN3543_c0_g1_i1:56-973(+)
MAGGGFVRPKTQNQSQIHYDVPSAVAPLITRAEGRLTQMTKWRKDYRYRLKDNEKSDLSSMMGKQQLYSTLMYASIGTVWWITGIKNPASFYDRFAIKGDLKRNLLSLQSHKLQFGITTRLISSFAVTIPFSFLLAQAQDEYFQKALTYNTIFGGFSRYLDQQGKQVAHGSIADTYIPGGSYQERVEKKLRPNTRKTELLNPYEKTQTNIDGPTKEAIRVIAEHESAIANRNANANKNSPQFSVVETNQEQVRNRAEAIPSPMASLPAVRQVMGTPKHFVVQDPDLPKAISDPTEDFITHVYGRF